MSQITIDAGMRPKRIARAKLMALQLTNGGTEENIAFFNSRQKVTQKKSRDLSAAGATYFVRNLCRENLITRRV